MFDDTPQNRRRFLRTAMGFSAGALLAGCGGGDGSSGGDTVTVVPAPVAVTPAPAAPVTAVVSHPLNIALNLAYLGAQFYGTAARGSGLPANLIGGTGSPGPASGARKATFGETVTAGVAGELADDKLAHVAALRDRIGGAVAAQPALDLSVGTRSAFSQAAQAAGIVGAGASFDAYADDDNFLIGAFLIENAVAATYRTLLSQGADDATTTIVSALLGDSIYHGGLVRAMLDARAGVSPSLDKALTGATALLAALDGSDVGDQTLAHALGESSNLIDADGRPIPFTRGDAQVLRTLYLSTTTIGGFLPNGANGVLA